MPALPTAVAAGLWGLTPRGWRRLCAAAVVSLALHSALLFALHPARASSASQPGAAMLVARLAPLQQNRTKSVPAVPAAIVPAPPAPQLSSDAEASGSESQANRKLPVRRAQLRIEVKDLPPTPRYFLSSELEKRPVPVDAIVPTFPPNSGVREGRVLLRIFINERGVADRVAIVRAQPEGVFEESAIAAFGGAQYSPGMLEGTPVKSQLLLEVEYRNPYEGQARFGADRGSY